MNTVKILKKLREAEGQIAYASPERASKLTRKIVRIRMRVFKTTP